MPIEGDFYGWEDFVEWAENNNINLTYDCDWVPWWECWKAGYDSGLSTD